MFHALPRPRFSEGVIGLFAVQVEPLVLGFPMPTPEFQVEFCPAQSEQVFRHINEHEAVGAGFRAFAKIFMEAQPAIVDPPSSALMVADLRIEFRPVFTIEGVLCVQILPAEHKNCQNDEKCCSFHWCSLFLDHIHDPFARC